MNKEQLDLIVHGYSWKEIHSKNPYMRSFVKDDIRMNIYFTTMTITFQSRSQNMGTTSYKNINNMILLEDILMKHES